MHGLLRCNINTGIHARAGGADVSLRDVTIALDGKRWLECANDVTHRNHAKGFGNLKKVSWVEDCLGRRRLVFARSRGLVVGAARDGGRWKSQNRKIVPLPPYVEKPLNSKVIKSFVPEQRSRYVFFVFRDSYVLYGHSMYVSHIAD